MASNISQLVGSENPTPISVKNMVNGEQRKMALGDIKNALAFEKSPVKNMASADRTHQRKITLGDMQSGPSAMEKSPVKMDDVNNTMDESIDNGTASSKYVDYSDNWCNNLALSDDEVTRWIDMLNAARTMPMSPKSPPPFFDEEEGENPMPEIEIEPLSPPPPLPDDDDDEMFNADRTMSPSRPLTPPSLIDEQEGPNIEYEYVHSPFQWRDDDSDDDDSDDNQNEPKTPSSDSSMYYSFDGTFELEL